MKFSPQTLQLISLEFRFLWSAITKPQMLNVDEENLEII